MDSIASDWDPELRTVLTNHSYVDLEHRWLYVETPKCASSSTKHLLLDLAGASLSFNPMACENRLEMMVHDRAQIPYRALPELAAADIDRVLHEDGWFRFGFTRDPSERLFSAWKDKVFLIEPGFERYADEGGRKYVEFESFVDRICDDEDPRDCDPH